MKVIFLCHGNICRSTMAQSVMTHLVNELHREHEFYIDSAATSREEIGNGPHYGTVNKLRQVGIPVIPHKAVQMTQSDYDKYDLFICMDSNNIRNIMRLFGSDTENKVRKLMDYTDRKTDVADPWYTGNFQVTYDDICEGLIGMLNELKNAEC